MRPQGRVRGRSTAAGIYDNIKQPNSETLNNTSEISDEGNIPAEEVLTKVISLFTKFRENHERIIGSGLSTRQNLIESLNLPKVKEEPVETPQKLDEPEDETTVVQETKNT